MHTSFQWSILLCLVFTLVLSNFITPAAGQNGPVECKTSNDCVKAGLLNSYCRDEKHFLAGLRHHSECEPKRGMPTYLILFIYTFKYNRTTIN